MKIKTILQINTHISTDTSTGKQVVGLHRFYQRFCNSFVAYSAKETAGDQCFLRFGNSVDRFLSALLTRFFGNRYGHAFFSTGKLIRIIKKIKPTVVHIHCINAFDVNIYRLLNYLKRHHTKTIITEHAEFFHTGNCSHAFECGGYIDGCKHCPRRFFATRSLLFSSTSLSWRRMRNCFRSFDECRIVAVSPWLARRSNQSGIMEGATIVPILNGVDTCVFSFQRTSFLPKRIAFVSSDTKSSNKGFEYLIKIAERLSNYSFVVAGDYSESVVRSVGVPGNVSFFGRITSEEKLAEFYRQSLATLILSRVETFSMVLAESMSCGTPVVGFRCGGPESICVDGYAFWAEYGDVDTIVERLESSSLRSLDREALSKQAQDKYSFEKAGSEYFRLVDGDDDSLAKEEKW